MSVHFHSQVMINQESWPVRLASKVQGLLTLQVFLSKGGSLFGAVTDGNLSHKASLKGIKATSVEPTFFQNAAALFAKSSLFYDGNAIVLSPGLRGGGCTQSAEDQFFKNAHRDLDNALKYKDRGDRARSQGNLANAIRQYTLCLECMLRYYGEKGPTVMAALNELGDCHSENQDYAEALSYYKRSQAIRIKENNGEGSPILAKNIETLALIGANLDRYKNALDLLKKGESIFAKDLSKSVEAIESALEIFREIFGEDNSYVVRCLSSLGGAHLGLCNFQDSVDCYTQAQEVYKKQHNGAEDAGIAACITNIKKLTPNEGLLKDNRRREQKK